MSEEKKPENLLELPKDFLQQTFDILSLEDHLRAAPTSYAINVLFNDPVYWNKFLKKRYQVTISSTTGEEYKRDWSEQEREDWSAAKNLFLKDPSTRKREYLLIDRIGKNYVISEAVEGRYGIISKVIQGDEFAAEDEEEAQAINKAKTNLENLKRFAVELGNSLEDVLRVRPSVLIVGGYLKLEQTLGLSAPIRQNLQGSVVTAFILSGDLTVQQAIYLFSANQVDLNQRVGIWTLVMKGLVTMEYFLSLSGHVQRVLNNPLIVDFILHGDLTIQQAVEISPKVFNQSILLHLQREEIYGLIMGGWIKMEHFLGWPDKTAYYISEYGSIIDLIVNGELASEDISNLSKDNLCVLSDPKAPAFIRKNKITVKKLLAFNPDIAFLLLDEKISLEQANRSLTLEDIGKLKKCESSIGKELTFDAVLALSLEAVEEFEAREEQRFELEEKVRMEALVEQFKANGFDMMGEEDNEGDPLDLTSDSESIEDEMLPPFDEKNAEELGNSSATIPPRIFDSYSSSVVRFGHFASPPGTEEKLPPIAMHFADDTAAEDSSDSLSFPPSESPSGGGPRS